MVYKWKIQGVVPVDAQTAGEELTRIYEKNGRLDPADVVEESRKESAPLHSCFEWDDQVAAEKYRESQAANIIRLIVSVQETDGVSQEVRSFVHIQKSYEPITVVVNDEEKMEELLRTALAELASFRKKYKSLSQLSPVFEAMDKISA